MMKLYTFIFILFQFSNQLNFLDDSFIEQSNSCLALKKFSNNSTYLVDITNKKKKSEITLYLMIKNYCESSKIIKDLKIRIDSWRINSNLISDQINVKYTGPSFLDIQYPKISSDIIEYEISSKKCRGLYCDWENCPSKGEYLIVLSVKSERRIDSTTVKQISIIDENIDKINGTLNLIINGSKISNTNKSIEIKIISDTGLSLIIKYNSTLNRDLLDVSEDLNPGNYRFDIDQEYLKINDYEEITYLIFPTNFQIFKGKKTNVIINFDIFKKVDMEIQFLNDLIYTKDIYVNMLNLKNKNKTILNFTKDKRIIKIPRVDIGDEFLFTSKGYANPMNKIFYEPLNLKISVLLEQYKNIYYVYLTFKNIPDTEIFNVNFYLKGFDILNNLPNIYLSSQSFIYSELKFIKTESILSFYKKEEVSIDYSEEQGFMTKISSKIINNQINTITILNTKLKYLGGYYLSWNSPNILDASKSLIANFPSYIKYILISFADPNMNYSKGDYTFKKTGLGFLSDFNLIKKSIEIAKNKNKDQKFLLTLGGQFYYFVNINYDSVIDLMDDLGLDGINIDYHNSPNCINRDTANIMCNTDKEIINIIKNFHDFLPDNKLLTASVSSYGAYGDDQYPNSQYGPISYEAGMWINPLITINDILDTIFIMSFDSSSLYSPYDAFRAYRNIFKKDIILGMKIPPEEWGDHILSVKESLKYAEFIQENDGAGLFIWSFDKKEGDINSNSFISPVCIQFGYECSQKIPIE